MKYLTKTTLWLLAFIMASGLLISCVEDEQAPDFDKMGESTSDIDVKMPHPNSKTFFPGSPVLLKGSGFSASDEVYVQYAHYQYDEETGAQKYEPEGPKVKAEVRDFNPSELTFLVPTEITQGHGSGDAIVFFKRGGKEYQLGSLYFQPFPVNAEPLGPMMGGATMLLRSYDPGVTFGDNDKVFIQNCINDENGMPHGVGEKIAMEIESVNFDEIRCVIPLNFRGEAVIIFRHDDTEHTLESFFSIAPPIMISTPEIVGGMEAELTLMNETLSFSSTDKVYLQPVTVNDNGELTDNGDRLAAVTRMSGGKFLYFTPPVDAEGTYTVIWEHKGEECRTVNYLTIHFPVYLETEAARIGDVLSLRSMVINLFASTDEVYLRPVGGENRVKAEIVGTEEWRLLFTLPDLFGGASGKAVVIYKRNGVEYELIPEIMIYGNN